MQIERLLDELRSDPLLAERIVHLESLPAQEAEYGEVRRPLPEALQQALVRQGISRLYTHQAEALEAARAGEDWVVVTGTASGKTLCYNLPILEQSLLEPNTCALYLFPLKALAQDQHRKLQELDLLSPAHFATYDGDTPAGDRRAVRQTARWVLSNPDMLHLGILPSHRLWARFFSHLRYVVLDELHTYRGIFGAHMANVLRRLERVCALYGSRPQYLCASATLGRPAGLAQQLLGRSARVIEQDGSPRGPRWVALWNPPWVDRAAGLRRSANLEAADLLVLLMRAGVRTLVFTVSRVAAELILRYTRERLQETAPELVAKVRSYRAGYLPSERREIERQLFSGELLGVISTVALEAGIDVGGLDATLLTGYPGSLASFWQQVGRAGRGQRPALSVLIALNGPVDQFLLQHPRQLLGEPVEEARINPHNVYVLGGHLLCGAFESPLQPDEATRFGPDFASLVRLFEQEEILVRHERWFWNGTGYPADLVSLRAIAGDVFRLVDLSQGGAVLGVMEKSKVYTQAYEGAIYLHAGEVYRVVRLDWQQREIGLEPVQVSEYTTPLVRTDVEILIVQHEQTAGGWRAGLGEVTVRQEVVGYRRLEQITERLLEQVPLAMPADQFDTSALWIAPPRQMEADYRQQGLHPLGGLHGAEHSLVAMLPLFALCDVRDVGGASLLDHDGLGGPGLFVYDNYPGGVGLAETGFAHLPDLLQAALDAIRHCPCDTGCPACVQSPFCGSGNQPLDKRAAARLLEECRAGW